MRISSRAALLAGLALSSVDALPTISSVGAKLFTSDGNQFFIKGVAYQGSPDDPLASTTQCKADAALMQTIGVNSIRVYHVDPEADHDGCMAIFEAAGIYVWLDLDTFTTYILQDKPAWTATMYSAYALVMDNFIKYDNLGGFWIGNEIITSASGSGVAPYIKAGVADMKAYRDAKKYRKVPIGYSAADIAELRPMLQNYLACGTEGTIDFFGLNSYEWCGPTNTFQGAGYANLQNMTEGYNTPIFFSETGCNVGGPRRFEDQSAILGPDMDETWSGAIIYEWVQEANDYGLVNYGASGALTGNPTAIAPDFTNLANQWKTLNPTGIKSAAYTPSFSAPACPASTAGGWLIDGGVKIPTLGVAAVTSIASSSGARAAQTATSGAAATSSGKTGTSAPSGSPTSAPTGPAAPAGTASTSSTSKGGAHAITSGSSWTIGSAILAAIAYLV